MSENSITKTNVSNLQIISLVKMAFGEDAQITGIKELKEGFFNSAYLVTLDKRKVVLKVAPSREIKVMRYEENLMKNEVLMLTQIASKGTVPVPKVLYYNKDKEIIENEFFFMEFVEGSPLNNIYDELSDQQRASISCQLGKYAKEITNIKSEFFGDISNRRKQFHNWGDAFLFMINELLLDARDKKIQLPYSYKEIYKKVTKFRPDLDMVKNASLLHKDLWKGNIFVDQKTAEIKGIVDCERAIFGDPLLEPVCGFLLHDAAFMKNFLGRENLDEDEKKRTILYRIYLFLIMVIECSFRQYPWEDSDKWARDQLREALEDLAGCSL